MPPTETDDPNWLSSADFLKVLASVPLVSVDAYVLDPQHRLLLGWRNNAPARGYWFTPGGRIRKAEPLAAAWQRVWAQELGWSEQLPVPKGRLLGAWDHLYPDSALDPKVSTHYVNLAYAVTLSESQLQTLSLPKGSGQQHDRWQWIDCAKALKATDVHAYVRTTLAEGLAEEVRRAASV